MGTNAKVAGVVAHYQDSGNNYLCKMFPGKLVVGKWVHGVYSQLASGPMSNTVNTFYLVSFHVSGAELTCSAAQGPTVTTTDSSLTGGIIALASWGPADFASVQVTTG
jgi:hypothetical protein